MKVIENLNLSVLPVAVACYVLKQENVLVQRLYSWSWTIRSFKVLLDIGLQTPTASLKCSSAIFPNRSISAARVING